MEKRDRRTAAPKNERGLNAFGKGEDGKIRYSGILPNVVVSIFTGNLDRQVLFIIVAGIVDRTHDVAEGLH